MNDSENPFEELAAKFDLLKQEVDALQVATMAAKRPWYRDLSTLVAILALTFSFGTTYVSYKRADAQDILASRAELRLLLQRLAALPKENLEITERYAEDAASLAYASGYISQETGLLARQAAEIANRLPRDQVTSSEYHAVSLALWNAGDAAAALPFAVHAIESATDAASAANALRAYGGDLFSLGQFEEGRKQYQAALGLFDKYPGYSDYYQKSTHFITQSAWAVWEANNGFLDLAEEHVATAESIVSQLPPGAGTDQFRHQIEQQRSVLDATGQQ